MINEAVSVINVKEALEAIEKLAKDTIELLGEWEEIPDVEKWFKGTILLIGEKFEVSNEEIFETMEKVHNPENLYTKEMGWLERERVIELVNFLESIGVDTENSEETRQACEFIQYIKDWHEI